MQILNRTLSRFWCALAALAVLLTPEANSTVVRKLDVVATIPDLKNIAEEIGGDRVKVTSIAKGTENIHAVALRPSNLVSMNRADLFVQMGLSLEHAFVPGLLMRGRNQRIQPGTDGFVNCGEDWKPIQADWAKDRSLTADVHPRGNPHFNLDPRGGRHMAKHILAGLIRVDPKGKTYYQERFEAYAKKLEQAEERWAKWAKSFKGQKICIYHRDFDYFALQRDLEIVDTIEPQPGMPPRPRDLAETIAVMREKKVRVILTGRWSNNKNTRFVAEKSGAQILELPTMVFDAKGVDTWIGMMDTLHRELAAVYAKE